jgi:hypothetical protein
MATKTTLQIIALSEILIHPPYSIGTVHYHLSRSAQKYMRAAFKVCCELKVQWEGVSATENKLSCHARMSTVVNRMVVAQS